MESTQIRPQAPNGLLKYPGSKDKLSRQLIRWGMLNVPHTTYAESFCGSAELLFHKGRSEVETINDIDPALTTLLEVVRDHGGEFKQRIAELPYSYDVWRHGRDTFLDLSLSPLDRAVAYFVARNMGHTGRPLGAYGQLRTACCVSRFASYHALCGQLERHSERLQGVQISNLDGKAAIMGADSPTTLHYIDPPYLFDTRQRPRERNLYRCDMGETAEHVELLNTLNRVEGMAMLSGYYSDLYRDMLPHWSTLEYETFVSIKSLPSNQIGTKRNRVTEVVWVNPQLSLAMMACKLAATL